MPIYSPFVCRREELEVSCPVEDGISIAYDWDGEWRPQAVRRLVQRYVGQCNLQTDIKEAVFLGQDQLVAAGSDDGNVYIFNAASGHLAWLHWLLLVQLIFLSNKLVAC